MAENNHIEIPLSKKKLVKLLIFSLIFLGVGIWMIIKDPQTSNGLFNNPIVKAIAFYGAVIMGLLGTYFFSKKLFDKNPGLILSEEGIFENSSAFKFGLIPWSDIAGIYESSIQASVASKQHFITIALHNQDEYISRETNFLKRKLMIANAKGYGSPVHITSNGLAMDHGALLKLMIGYFEKYGKR